MVSFVVLFVTFCLSGNCYVAESHDTILTILHLAWIALLTFKHWRVLRANELTAQGLDLNLISRTTAFTLWICLGMGLSVLSFQAPASPVPDMALATSA